MEVRTIVERERGGIDAMEMLKVDCIELGMQTFILKAFGPSNELGAHALGGGSRTIADVMAQEAPEEAVYEMISHADTIGILQIESRAQMSMLPRLKPRILAQQLDWFLWGRSDSYLLQRIVDLVRVASCLIAV